MLCHAPGDNILVQTANALTGLLGETDNIARLGGDEFAIVQHPSPQPASAVVQRMAQPIFVDEKRVAVSASIGIAFANETGHDYEELLSAADKALYAAKEMGEAAS